MSRLNPVARGTVSDTDQLVNNGHSTTRGVTSRMLFRRAIGALRRAHLDRVPGMATQSTRIAENLPS
jgi:hypothetical protein